MAEVTVPAGIAYFRHNPARQHCVGHSKSSETRRFPAAAARTPCRQPQLSTSREQATAFNVSVPRQVSGQQSILHVRQMAVVHVGIYGSRACCLTHARYTPHSMPACQLVLILAHRQCGAHYPACWPAQGSHHCSRAANNPNSMPVCQVTTAQHPLLTSPASPCRPQCGLRW